MPPSRRTVFRANDSAAAGRESAIHHYTRALKTPGERQAAAEYIDTLIRNYGPVVEGYPSWHPFVFSETKELQRSDPQTRPQEFKELNHPIYFRDAFVTAPYGDAEEVIKSAHKKKGVYIVAEEIDDVILYNYNTTPVLVTTSEIPKEEDGTITKRFALGRMLSTELPAWIDAECGESWEDMRRYILGPPCGNRSSLFVNQNTGQALREVFELLNHHELWGPSRY